MVSKVVKTMRILIADNEFSVSNALSALIREQPAWHLVGVVTDGNELGIAITTCRPDLVLIDLCLPGLFLHELVRSMRFTIDRPFLVAICRDQEEKDQAFATGIDFAICKIESPDRLIEALHATENRIAQVT